MADHKSLRVLALDGGGVRGLSTLIILQYLMKRVAADSNAPPKPCDFFDLIGGTSTGGLLAIMLGRLKLDIQTCINVYLKLSEDAFQPSRSKMNWLGKSKDFATVKGRFSSDKLTTCIKQVIEEYGKLDKEAPLFEGDTPRCRAFVCAVRADAAKPVKFRTYKTTEVDEVKCKIWEAGRATSAASTFFDPITIGPYGERFVDGAVGTNNPVEEVYQEARALWPQKDIQCFVSIGTGHPGTEDYGHKNLLAIIETLKRISTETEKTAEAFWKTQNERNLHGRYFRFNVTHGLEGISLEEYKEKAKIAARTNAYLSSGEILERVGQFATLVMPSPSPTEGT
ncbi:phospholipase [Clohesyomyces aquaticus]|uniref:Phospholipase n=1 Tax=Clohesyomyces aquaticus TaxID=1231657 RepID=A0A1Y1ZBT9_9PLEO|nr:phospholipase [Clohesyomyces aquaticus]